MFNHAEIKKTDDLFLPLSQRGDQIAYFGRMTGYSPEAAAFVLRFYRAAVRSGATSSFTSSRGSHALVS